MAPPRVPARKDDGNSSRFRKMCIRDRSTAVWLSAAVEKIWLFLVGIVVFLSISLVAIPPMVSMDRDSGVTSRRRISPAPASPASLPPCTEAPRATHSSGFRVLLGSLPVSCFTSVSYTHLLLHGFQMRQGSARIRSRMY